MSEKAIYDALLIAMFPLAAIVFVALSFVVHGKAPYGRYNRAKWGAQVKAKLGWVIMESPAVIIFALSFALGSRTSSAFPLLFLAMWQIHYIHRTYIFPFQMRSGQKQMTLLVMSMGFTFNAINGYLNGRYLGTFGPGYPAEWITDPRFIIGVLLFLCGFAINRHSDVLLRQLRKPGESGYKIPYGGLFERISCANYFGEIVQWFGWATATWSLPGLAFAVWTAANLAPRAQAHHRWYLKHFPDYPRQRRALVPFVY